MTVLRRGVGAGALAWLILGGGMTAAAQPCDARAAVIRLHTPAPLRGPTGPSAPLLWMAILSMSGCALALWPARWQREVSHGRLVPADEVTGGVTRPLDLRARAILHDRARLLVGNTDECDFVVIHDDVDAQHAWVHIEPDAGGRLQFQLAPAVTRSLTLNGQVVLSPAPLADGDIVGLGMLRFVFEMAERYRPIVIEYRDGTSRAGFPVEWSPGAPLFLFRDRHAARSSPPDMIRFEEVRAVHFVTDWDPEVRERIPFEWPYIRHRRAHVRFVDGEELRGWVTPDYHPDQHQFHFLPREGNGIMLSLIQRAAVESVVTGRLYRR